MAEQIEYPNLELEISDIATIAVSNMVDRLAANRSNVTGALSRSIKVKTTTDKNGVITAPISLLQYGIYVDDGAERGPGRMPPVAPLLQWIKLKRITVPSAMTPLQFAFAVARSIGKNGQRYKKPKPFIDVSLQAALDQNLQQVADAAALDVANNIQTNYGTLPTQNIVK